jgi:hypothetical protein
VLSGGNAGDLGVLLTGGCRHLISRYDIVERHLIPGDETMSTLCKTYSDEGEARAAWSGYWPRGRPAAASGC